ncbi:mandelate racemase/muconate lactonizing enzyme family protein [Bordetella bronchialis]|uniref:mandelate racemase/muconate lactonizing enzyme family protein n=1 Tax=Bordetella bronchialis TaxID=463025 RepID=UPI003D062A94
MQPQPRLHETTDTTAPAVTDVQAWAVSFPVPPAHSVRLGVGRALKRDAVIVKVTTADGLVGWGESHHGRAHSSIAHFVNHALRPMVVGMQAADVNGIWQRIYAAQLASHGIGAGCAIAMSGIDMALWDIRAKAVGWPLYRLLGGAGRRIPAYAGGVALGWQEPASLVEEAAAHVGAGYKALKLRLGDSVARDLARVQAVRDAFGDDLVILTDANAAYTLGDARQAIPALDALGVGWLEEPFPAHDYRNYESARAYGRIAFAAGENHYTRFEFSRLVDDRVVDILQPDLSKTGGITETLRIAALGSAYKLPVHPHSSMTGINMAATLHVLAAIDQGGYFEADVSRGNLFRDALVSTPFTIGEDGCVAPPQGPGIGVEVDEDFLAAHPPIEGPAYA